MSISRVCVYCASSSKIPQIYLNGAKELGRILSQNSIAVNYGGGGAGCMGALADSMIEHGGMITGIIPEFMVKVEWEHKGVSDMIHVKTMTERKQFLIKNAEAVIALPGGPGTMEELWEVISMKKLGKFPKPIILINTQGFYDSIIQMFNVWIKEQFISPHHFNLVKMVNKPEEIINALNTTRSSEFNNLLQAATR